MQHSTDGITLALDTSSPFISVCVARGNNVIASWESEVPTQSSELLFERVHTLLVEASEDPALVREIVLGAGPGSFTGLRIGFAFALGIATGNRGKVRMYPSHQAWSAISGAGQALCLSDARRGEFFVSAWDGNVELIQPQIGSLQTVTAFYAQLAARGPLRVISSDAAVPFECVLQRPTKMAEGLVMLAAAGVASLPASSAPLYLREVAAKTIAERAAGGRQIGNSID
jgi:tRNA threonylcarbamoyladenosine biosynthesis protein TsaB